MKVPIPVKVDKPDTFKLSNSVSPSTSRFPLASIAPANVLTPATLRSSNSAWPSTSKDPLASISLAKVENPVIFKCLAVISCPIDPPPPPVI